MFYMWRSQLGEIDRSMPCAYTDFICQSPARTTIMRHHTLMHPLLSCTIRYAIVWYIMPRVMIKGAKLNKVELSFPYFLDRRERSPTKEKHEVLEGVAMIFGNFQLYLRSNEYLLPIKGSFAR